ncbi:MAG: hypothetical protein GF418_04090 [Chitinivibrionales bacterium]|nr:hypothetical protein [Chitinivibrionales bacterium]MBD3394787.1 hypothetical protein [Chitinivibrionales bacterium]
MKALDQISEFVENKPGLFGRTPYDDPRLQRKVWRLLVWIRDNSPFRYREMEFVDAGWLKAVFAVPGVGNFSLELRLMLGAREMGVQITQSSGAFQAMNLSAWTSPQVHYAHDWDLRKDREFFTWNLRSVEQYANLYNRILSRAFGALMQELDLRVPQWRERARLRGWDWESRRG